MGLERTVRLGGGLRRGRSDRDRAGDGRRPGSRVVVLASPCVVLAARDFANGNCAAARRLRSQPARSTTVPTARAITRTRNPELHRLGWARSPKALKHAPQLRRALGVYAPGIGNTMFHLYQVLDRCSVLGSGFLGSAHIAGAGASHRFVWFCRGKSAHESPIR
jgi:hypothetical protein